MLRIDLYTEITCPWCFVGLHRLDKVLRERFSELTATIHHHPILLLPDAPATGLYIPDLLRARYGVVNPQAAFSRPEAAARESGFDLDLSRQLYAYPTQAAHAIISAASERGAQHQLAVAITDAYFLDARNISDVEVLSHLAAAHGFSKDEARVIALDPRRHARIEQEAANSNAAGVSSVPHFVFGSHVAVNGGRSEDEIAHLIEESLQAAEGRQ